MESSTPHSSFLCPQPQGFHLYQFFKRFCFILFTVFLILVLAVGLGAVVVVYVLKPQTPIFAVQTVKLDTYKLVVKSGSELYVSSVAASLTLNAQNPNKVGIRFSPSRLYVLQDGLVVGIIRVPPFNQPPRGSNVTMQAEVVIDCVDISKITAPRSDPVNGNSQMRLLGDVRAQLQILQVTLPRFKIALDCDINIDHNHLVFSNKLFSILKAKDHVVPTSFGSGMFSKRCSLAIYI